MIGRIIKGLAALVVLIVLSVPVGALFLDDDTLRDLLVPVPVVGDNAGAIVQAKRDIASTLSTYADDTAKGFSTLFVDVLGLSAPSRTPRVVVDLPPPRPQPGAPALISPQPPEVSVEPPSAAQIPDYPKSGPPPPESGGPPAPPAPPGAETATPKAKARMTPPVKPAPKPASKPSSKPGGPPDAAAEQDYKRGLALYKGIGVTKDFKKAAVFFRRAANKGHANAQYILGIMSYIGQGVDQDFAASAKWFRMAAEQDHAVAQYNLGYLYFEGKGVEKDNLQAYMWIDRAATLGDEKAVRARDTLQKALPKEIFQQ